MMQRSINHPMFGLYPASYMWGKVGPELIRAIAVEPFGMNTGAALYSLIDLQKAVAVQRQYDPSFEAKIEELGENPALSFLGYMLPATPWSVPASFPGWLRDIADQGLENNARMAAGGEAQDLDFISPLTSTIKKLWPMSTTVPWAARALDEVGSALPWNAPPELDENGNPIIPDSAPLAQPPPEGLTVPETEAATADLSRGVSALDTEAILANQMRELQELLGS
jgi:hypothetical protein